MRRRIVWLTVAVAVAAIAVTFPTSAPPQAVCAPESRAVTVNQGLNSYAKLIRGKQTLVRLYLGLGSCANVAAGAYAEIRAATLKVKNGSTVLAAAIPTTPETLGRDAPLPATFPVVTTSGTPTLADTPADLKFVVPGSTLAPASTTGTWTATFEATITYKFAGTSTTPLPSTSSTVTFTKISGTNTSITKAVDKRTRALRVLAVPIKTAPMSTAATDVWQAAALTATRILPVPDGTQAAAAVDAALPTTGGFRYAINGGAVNVNSLIPSGQTRLCATGNNWPTIKSSLASFLQAYNAANSGNPADKVVGVGDPADMIGTAENSSCAEGFASTNSPEAMIRASQGSAGSLAALELCHTFGCVASGFSDGGYHAVHPNADWATGDADRAYNVTDAQFLANDKTAMRFATSGWDNSNTVLEAGDYGYGYVACKLEGSTTASACRKAGTTGTTVGVAASGINSFVMTGKVTKPASGPPTLAGLPLSYTASTLPMEDPNSPFRLLEKNAAGTVVNGSGCGALISFDDSVHHSGSAFATSGTSSFSVACPVAPGVASFQFVYSPAGGTTTVLHTVSATGTAPTISTEPPPPPILLASTTSVTSSAQKPDPGKAPGKPVKERHVAPTPPEAPGGGGGGISIASITPSATSPAGATAIADAVNADPGLVTSATFDAAPPTGAPNGTGDSSLAGFPTNGDTFGILTSGDVELADDANTSGSSGANDGGGNVRGNTDFDVSILKIGLNVPSGANCLSVDFKFLSEEFPEYVGSTFNDGFIAELGSSTWTTSGSNVIAPNNFAFGLGGEVISVNSVPMSAGDASGTTYDGATQVLTANTPITGGTHVLYLSIFDQGDHIYDSAVFLDNLKAFFTAGACEPGAEPAQPTQEVSWQATDTDTDCDDLRANVLLKRPGSGATGGGYDVLAAGLEPTSCASPAQFDYETTTGCTGCEIHAFVYDGNFSDTEFVEPSEINTLPTDPIASINSPANLASFYPTEAIVLDGGGFDYQGGQISDSDTDWTSAGTLGTPSPLFTGTMEGRRVVLQPPAAGWEPGTYDITLTVTDSNSNTDSKTVRITVLVDKDGDHVEESLDFENGCTSGADNNRLNVAADADGDGKKNTDERYTENGPCVDETSYGATNAVWPEDPYNPEKSGPTVAVSGVSVPGAPAQVPTANICITKVNDDPVSGLCATDSIFFKGVYGLKFSRSAVNAVLDDAEYRNRRVLIEITGNGGTFAWVASVSPFIK